MTPLETTLPDGHLWLRVADPDWADPLDPTYAAELGGRWNPPGTFPTLSLNEDLATARFQVVKLLEGTPVQPEDLGSGFDLVTGTLPRAQVVADAVSDDGLEALGLPITYPRHGNGRPVGHDVCRAAGVEIHDSDLRGVRARSAATDDGSGHELAWFPARRSSRAHLVERRAFRDWWHSPPA